MMQLHQPFNAPCSPRLITLQRLALFVSSLYLALPPLPSAHAELLHNSPSYSNGDLGPWPYTTFYSTDQNAPRLNSLQWDPECEDGLNVFFTPRCDVYRGGVSASACPTILDDKGELVWRTRDYGQVNNIKIQHFKGQDYLTFWGKHNGQRDGEYFMLNSAYEEVYRFKAVGEVLSDFHEWRVTSRGTALVSIYKPRHGNMTAFGRDDGWFYDSGFQEIDIDTGKLLFEWFASRHLELTDTYMSSRVVRIMKSGTKKKPLDFYHFNSVQEDSEGNYLISSRHSSTISYISGKDGSILWNLGGKHNSFTDLTPTVGPGATKFGWQHHARWESEEEKIIRLFNNQESQFVRPHVAKQSLGLMIKLDMTNMTAEIIQKLEIPEPTPPFISVAEGNFQRLENGDSFINWGAVAAFTQYNSTGGVRCNVHYGPEKEFGARHQQCYRVYKGKWVGRPNTRPDIKVEGASVYVSWMGSTEVTQWSLQGLPESTSTAYTDIQTITKQGFESAFVFNPSEWHKVKVTALDKNNDVLSETISVKADGSEPRTGVSAKNKAAQKTEEPPPSSSGSSAGIDQLAGQDPYPNTKPIPPPGEEFEDTDDAPTSDKPATDPPDDEKSHHIDLATAGDPDPAPVLDDDEPIIDVAGEDKTAPEGPVDERPDDPDHRPGYNTHYGHPAAAADVVVPEGVSAGDSVAKAGLKWSTLGVETSVHARGFLSMHLVLLMLACGIVVCVMRGRARGLFARKRYR